MINLISSKVNKQKTIQEVEKMIKKDDEKIKRVNDSINKAISGQEELLKERNNNRTQKNREKDLMRKENFKNNKNREGIESSEPKIGGEILVLVKFMIIQALTVKKHK